VSEWLDLEKKSAISRENDDHRIRLSLKLGAHMAEFSDMILTK
jgi:hypothetical protein